MPVYKLKFYCEECKKDFYIDLQSKFKLNQQHLDRFTNELKQKHNIKEHTHCFRCKKKLPEGKGEVRILGRRDPLPHEVKKKTSFVLLFGKFCDKCNKILKKRE